MAKVTINPSLIKEIHGAIGGLLYYPDGEGGMIVQRVGERPTPDSEGQIAHQSRFRLASAYGNKVKLDPILANEYRLFCRGRMGPYHAGLRDFMTPPVISGIDLQAFTGKPGQLIRIAASDDCRVLSVSVIVRQATGGAILEEGPAALSVIANHWLYTSQTEIASGTALMIEATATDRPGNAVTARVHFCP